MNWLIIAVMTTAQPFSIPTLKFDSKQECVKYVLDPNNSDRLAVEVIAKAGFNDKLINVLCLPENNNMIEREYEG